MNFNHVINTVTDIFERDFEKAYNQLELSGKSQLLRYYFSFYRKWTMSALVNNTFLTPNNVIALANKEYHKKIFTTTVPTVKTFKTFKKFTFCKVSYSLDAHPVVEDLRIVVAALAPSFTITTADNRSFSMLAVSLDGYLDEAQELKLMQLVSLQDPFYVAYLFRVAVELGLITRMPALYSAKMQVTLRFDELFGKKLTNKKSREILDEIVAVSVKFAADTINAFFVTDDTVNIEYILQAITNPTSSDEMFNYIYDMLGIDFQSIIELDSKDSLPEEYHEIMSSAFALGAIISIHISTVFGSYLQLINPVYFGSSVMAHDMAFVQDAIVTNHDIEIPLFMPCTFFMPTKLGLRYFKLSCKNTLPLPIMSSFEHLMDALENIDKVRVAMRQPEDEHDTILDEALLVYEFKVKLDDAPSFWKRVALVSDTTLDEFAAFIAYEFFGSFTSDYGFHIMKNVNSYTDVFPARRKMFNHISNLQAYRHKQDGKSAEEITIEEFLKACTQEFSLILRYKNLSSKVLESKRNKYEQGAPIKISVTCVGGRETFHRNFYPSVTGEGKAFSEL